MEYKNTKFDIGKIEELKNVWFKIQDYNMCFRKLSEPVLNDLALLSKVHEAYLNVYRRRGCEEQASRVYNRKKFLLVVLYLFSPKTLVGDRMRIGLRDKLAEMFGLTTSTAISDNCSSIMFCYEKYRDFRRDVDVIYNEVVTILGDQLPH